MKLVRDKLDEVIQQYDSLRYMRIREDESLKTYLTKVFLPNLEKDLDKLSEEEF